MEKLHKRRVRQYLCPLMYCKEEKTSLQFRGQFCDNQGNHHLPTTNNITLPTRTNIRLDSTEIETEFSYGVFCQGDISK